MIKKLIAAAAAIIAAAVVVLLLISAALTSSTSEQSAGASPCVVQAGNTLPPNEARDRNVQTWIAVGRAKSIPARGILIGIAVILVESEGRNLASQKVPESKQYPNDGVAPGDHDSIGTAQQRVIGYAWWPSIAEGMKVPVQAAAFYSALVNINGWQVMEFGSAAQAVQRSAFPGRYAQRQDDAVALYNRLAGTAGSADIVNAGNTTVCQEAASDVVVAVSGKWANPLSPAKYVMTSPFGPRVDPVLGIPKPHKGQDLGTAGGTPIKAPCDSVAKKVGWDAWGGGNMTTLDCGGGIIIKLMHQSRFAAGLKAGVRVEAGQVIGYVGTTGNSTGDHLHEQVEFKGTPIDPVPFMRDRGVPLCATQRTALLPAC